MKNLFTTGDYAPSSGQYEIVGPRGGKFEGREITMIKGRKFPPIKDNENKKLYYKLVDSTIHISDVKRK